MFTGIIETIGQVVAVRREGANYRFRVRSSVSAALKIDQSIAHDGVCLTVVAQEDDWHEVVAIHETIEKTTLGNWQPGYDVNLERAMVAGARLDGHMVQGHVDTRATCMAVTEQDGSWLFRFGLEDETGSAGLIVDKGSICINGISLTVVQALADGFEVAIIPYTFAHTNLGALQPGQPVNIEFDILGKYIQKHIGHYLQDLYRYRQPAEL